VLVEATVKDAGPGAEVGAWAAVSAAVLVVARTEDVCKGLGMGVWAAVSSAELVVGSIRKARVELGSSDCAAL